jgi:lipopolysaccharide transport protein LptA
VTPRSRSGPLGGERPWQASSRLFDYDAGQKTARYRDGALLRTGDDEVRGALIVVDEARPGQRRLSASGGVRSILQSRPRGREEPERRAGKKPVETESTEMLYEESKRTVVYSGDVRIRQGDITTRSPEATVFLTADGSRMERIVAGEPVEVHQGQRRANGTRGTYTPENETLVLVGEKVVLEDPKQRLQGRSLTFRMGDDTILVDGREVERTESVFRREPARP